MRRPDADGPHQRGPYRDAGADEPRYVCLVCLRSLSSHPGTCPRCGVARLGLHEAEVRVEVRRTLEAQLERRELREELALAAVATVIACATILVEIVGVTLLGDTRFRPSPDAVLFVLAMLFVFLLPVIVSVFSTKRIAVFAARRGWLRALPTLIARRGQPRRGDTPGEPSSLSRPLVRLVDWEGEVQEQFELFAAYSGPDPTSEHLVALLRWNGARLEA